MLRPAVVLIVAMISAAWGAPLAARQDDLGTRVAWLQANAVPLRSIDPSDTDFADLRGLADYIGDARIVMLGEQTHGDGATFHAKTRLIEFLHQELGFDVLAFEGSFYGMPTAWEMLREGGEADVAIRRGLGRVWVESEQVRPLIEYVEERARSDVPLEITGFDSQLGVASREALVDELAAVARRLEPTLVSGDGWGETRAALDSLVGGAYYAAPLTPFQHRRITSWLDALAQATEAADPGSEDDADLGYLRQLVESVAAQTDAIATWDPSDSQEFGNIRDAQMARNLVWLARERYADRKLIVWAATFHVMRNHRTIDRMRDGSSYDGVTVMGHDVWEALGEQTYVVGFTAHGGSWGLYNGEPQELPAPPPGSIEDLFGRTSYENAFLDFRHRDAGGAWLEERLLMRPLGNWPMRANWTRVMDAVVFTRTMYPSTRASR